MMKAEPLGADIRADVAPAMKTFGLPGSGVLTYRLRGMG
jgi:hypothetical protein